MTVGAVAWSRRNPPAGQTREDAPAGVGPQAQSRGTAAPGRAGCVFSEPAHRAHLPPVAGQSSPGARCGSRTPRTAGASSGRVCVDSGAAAVPGRGTSSHPGWTLMVRVCAELRGSSKLQGAGTLQGADPATLTGARTQTSCGIAVPRGAIRDRYQASAITDRRAYRALQALSIPSRAADRANAGVGCGPADGE